MSCINVLRMTGLYRSDKTVLVTKYGSAYAVGWWRAQLHPDRDRRARETLKQVSLVAERLAPLRSECWDRPAYLRGPVTVKKWDAALDRIASSFNTSSSDRMLASHLMQNRVRLPVVDARIVRGRADYLPKCDVVGRTLDFGSYGSPVLLRGIGPESGVGSMNSTGVGSKLSDSLDSRGRTSETCYSPDRLSRSISTSTDDLGSMESISETRYSPSPSRRSIGVSTDDLPGFSPQPQMTASKAQMMQLIASRRIDPLSLRAIDDMRVSTTSVESVGTTIGSSVSSYRRSGYSLPRGMVEVRAEVYRSDSSGGRERIADAIAAIFAGFRHAIAPCFPCAAAAGRTAARVARAGNPRARRCAAAATTADARRAVPNAGRSIARHVDFRTHPAHRGTQAGDGGTRRADETRSGGNG